MQRIDPTLVMPPNDERASDPELVLPSGDGGARSDDRWHSRNWDLHDEDSRRIVWFVMIVAGTAIGGLIAYFAVRWYETRQVEMALAEFQRTVVETSIGAQREVVALAERMAATQAMERERAAAEVARREAAKREAAAWEARRAADARLQAEQKEVAWHRYYRPSEGCRNPDNRASMTCANEHARAKREFERRWERGELQ